MENGVVQQIAVNSFWNFLMVLSARIGGLIFIIIIARFLLPESFGIYNLALSIALILLVSVDNGIDQSLLRYVSEAFGNKNKKLAAASYKYLLKLKMIITLFLALFLVIISYPVSIYLFKKPSLFLPLLFSSFYLIAYSWGSFYTTYFYVIEKVNYITIKQLIYETSRIFGVFFIFLFISQKFHVIGTISILSITMFISSFFLIYNLKRINPFLFEKTDVKVDRKRIFEFFLYLSAIGSFLVIFGYIDTIMIGIFLEASYIGFYSAALALTSGLWSLLNISNILLPIFTKMKDHDLQTAFDKVVKYLVILAIPAIFGIFVLGEYFIKYIYGPEYISSIYPFYILSFLILEIPLISIITSLFSSREKPKYVVNTIIIAALMNVILNYLLIKYFLKFSPELAIVGAAIATLASQTFYLFGLIIYTKKELKIKVKFRYLTKPIIASIAMVLVLYFFNSQIKEINLIYGLIEVLIGVFIYFIVMIFIKGIGKNDFNLLRNVLLNS